MTAAHIWPADAGAGLTVDLDAVAWNWRLIRDRVAPAQCAAVVKADGYGLGATFVARRLAAEGCGLFFVAQVGEGESLRAALPDPAVEIAVLNGLAPGTEAMYADARLLPVLNDLGQVERWLSKGQAPQTAILHVDTGMNRSGLRVDEALAALDDGRLPAAGWRLVMSHLASADTPDSAQNERQRLDFLAVTARLQGVTRSLSASSGSFLGPAFAFDLARPGAALYGVAPVVGAANPMRPTIRLDARILQVRRVDSGDSVGYGATHSVVVNSRIATLALGYADGYLRAGGGRGVVYIDGRPAPIVGRISMDLTTIDVSAIPDSLVQPGAMVEVIGPHRSVDVVAADAGTVGYEILTSLGRRYARRHLGDAGALA